MSCTYTVQRCQGQIDDKTALDAVEAVLTAGTLSGAPKYRAMEIINELENNKRGIYGGAVGYLDFTGNLDTCIRNPFGVQEKWEGICQVRGRNSGRQHSRKRISRVHK